MDVDRAHTTDRFTKLMIFSCDYDFPVFVYEFLIYHKDFLRYYNGTIHDGYVANIHNTNTILAGGLLNGERTVVRLAPT